MKKGRLIVLSGPSGAGKGTICKRFLSEHPTVCLSVSATTRAPREGETDGVSYHFLKKEEFETLIAENALLEYARVFDQYYGTPKKFVEDKLAQGIDVILEIDVQGALQIKKQCPDGIFVFILPPTLRTLKERIIQRGSESEESLNKRFGKALAEIEVMHEYDYFIVNEDLEDAVTKLRAILVAEKCLIRNEVKEIICKFKEEECSIHPSTNL